MVYYNLLRGIAQLVACLVRDQEASGSNPDTPTNVTLDLKLWVQRCFFILTEKSKFGSFFDTSL